MEECDTRGCLGVGKAVLVEGERRLLCTYCQGAYAEMGRKVASVHKAVVWLAHLGPDNIRLDRGERNDRPWKWLFECSCGVGGTSWSWSRAYDMANSNLSPEQWIEENGQPVGGALVMALDHLGIGPDAEAAKASIKED